MSKLRSTIFPLFTTTALAIFLLLALAMKVEVVPAYLSPSDLDMFDMGRKLLITEHTANQMAIFDVEKKEVIRTIKLEMPPSGATVSLDEKQFYVTVGKGPGQVLERIKIQGR